MCSFLFLVLLCWHYCIHICCQVLSNQEAVDCIKHTKCPQTAAKQLTEEALARKSTDDISCVVVKFRWSSQVRQHLNSNFMKSHHSVVLHYKAGVYAASVTVSSDFAWFLYNHGPHWRNVHEISSPNLLKGRDWIIQLYKLWDFVFAACKLQCIILPPSLSFLYGGFQLLGTYYKAPIKCRFITFFLRFSFWCVKI